MPKFRVGVYLQGQHMSDPEEITTYEIEAEDRDDAIAQAEKMAESDFHFGYEPEEVDDFDDEDFDDEDDDDEIEVDEEGEDDSLEVFQCPECLATSGHSLGCSHLPTRRGVHAEGLRR